MNRNFSISLWLLTIGVAAQSIQWINVVGPIAVSDLGLGLIVLSLLPRVLNHARIANLKEDRVALAVSSTLFLNIVAVFASVLWSDDPGVGFKLAVRDILGCGLLVYFYVGLRSLPKNVLVSTFGTALFLSAVAFVVLATLSLTARGYNVFDIYLRAIISADPNLVQYEFFNRLFMSESDDQSAHGRHSIFMLFSTGAIINWMSVQSSSNANDMSQRSKWVAQIQAIALTLLVFVSLSRQSALMLCAYGVIALRDRLARMLAAMFVVALIGVLIFTPAGELITAKFVDDVAENPRIQQFHEACDEIFKSPVLGVGAGTLISGSSEDFYAHNLVLHGWHQAGLLGLGTALIALIVVAFFMLKLASRSYLAIDSQHAVFAAACFAMSTALLSRYLFGLRGGTEIASILSVSLALLISQQDEDEAEGQEQFDD